jgi:hypothetical protein
MSALALRKNSSVANPDRSLTLGRGDVAGAEKVEEATLVAERSQGGRRLPSGGRYRGLRLFHIGELRHVDPRLEWGLPAIPDAARGAGIGYALHAGYDSDPSPVSGPSQSSFRAVDLAGVSAGASFGRLTASLCVSSSWGTTTERQIGPSIGGLEATTDVSVRAFTVLYAVSFTSWGLELATG